MPRPLGQDHARFGIRHAPSDKKTVSVCSIETLVAFGRLNQQFLLHSLLMKVPVIATIARLMLYGIFARKEESDYSINNKLDSLDECNLTRSGPFHSQFHDDPGRTLTAHLMLYDIFARMAQSLCDVPPTFPMSTPSLATVVLCSQSDEDLRPYKYPKISASLELSIKSAMPRMARRSARSIARNRRVRYEQSVGNNGFEVIAIKFERDMIQLNRHTCIKCRRSVSSTVFSIQTNLCKPCSRANVNLFDIENGMDLGQIPPELQGLTLLEQILIARVHPIVSVFRIHGQQTGYSGHVMNFNQHIEAFAARLPHDPARLTSVILLNRDTPHGLITFRVRNGRVRRALNWLKNNNQYYRDITIDETILDSLPVDGDVSQNLPNLDHQPGPSQDHRNNDGFNPNSTPNNSSVHHEHSMSVNAPGSSSSNRLRNISTPVDYSAPSSLSSISDGHLSQSTIDASERVNPSQSRTSSRETGSQSTQSVLTIDADEAPDNLIGRSCYPNIQALDENTAIRRNLRRVHPDNEIPVGDWPDLSQDAANEFQTEGLICKAFPVLFPYGRGDLNAPRLHKISYRKYFQYLLEYHDGRFANDERFPYYAFNSVFRWDAINCGNVYVRQHQMEGLTGEDLAEVANNPNHDLAANIMYYGANLRGTRSFWKQRCSELLQMVRQVGLPSVFFTLSAADYHWPDLFRIICPDRDPASITESQRRRLMHENPATVAWFFEVRSNLFIKEFMCKFFSVQEYWYRFEWQHRGSPHVHGLFWLQDAPDCSDINSLSDADRQRIVSYFDQMVSATIGSRLVINPAHNPCRLRYIDVIDDARSSDLNRILNAVKRHSRCGPHCLRRKRNTRQFACRYGFPIELEENSCLRNEQGTWKFIPKRNDQFVQRYNKFVTQIWRGNSDFSPVTSKDAVLNYIAKYASKGEFASEAYSAVLQRVCDQRLPDSTAATLIRKLLVSSVAERNFSAQEVMHLTMGWPLYHASRSFVVLSVRSEWRQIGGTSNLVDRYRTRPDSIEDTCLLDFAKDYRIEGDRLVQRRNFCIVRVIPVVKYSEEAESNEDYFSIQCMLHIPWRGDHNNMRPDDMSWEHYYMTYNNNDGDEDDFSGQFPHPPDELEFEPEQRNPADLVRDANMVASRLYPNDLASDDPLGHRPIDQANQWLDLDSSPYSSTQINEYLQTFQSISVPLGNSTGTISDDLLSPEQREVLNTCRIQFQGNHDGLKRIIVQGKAGTGKSVVIQSICRKLDQVQESCGISPPRQLYEILAPTGAAALNVGGKTIHSFLRIPVCGPIMPLNGENLRAFQLQFKDIKFVLIDEYSMIGLRLLNKIHVRLCEARGDFSEPFGGYFIYLFGDLRQLPPVRDLPIYSRPADDDHFANLGTRLVASIQKIIQLRTGHRQSADVQFAQILDSLSTGNLTHAGWELLLTRRRCVLGSVEAEAFRNSIRLFPTNREVVDYNKLYLSRNRQAVAVIDADHNNTTARLGSDDQAQGLARQIHLSIGCRVMLRRNICVSRGLVNGSFGTVREIIYRSGESPPSLPLTILIDFDNFRGPYLADRCFPLKPVSTSWRDQSIDCTRRQFPITLAYAMTIHKSQGLTLESVVIELGPKETAPGLSYVALSRARKLSSLCFASGFDYNRLQMIGRMKATIDRERYLQQRLGQS